MDWLSVFASDRTCTRGNKGRIWDFTDNHCISAFSTIFPVYTLFTFSVRWYVQLNKISSCHIWGFFFSKIKEIFLNSVRVCIWHDWEETLSLLLASYLLMASSVLKVLQVARATIAGTFCLTMYRSACVILEPLQSYFFHCFCDYKIINRRTSIVRFQ